MIRYVLLDFVSMHCNSDSWLSSMFWAFVEWGDCTAARTDDTGVVYRRDYGRGILLYGLVRKFKPLKVLEIGTGRGYATICMVAGLRNNDEHYNREHKLVTIDSVSVVEVADRILYPSGTVKSSVRDLIKDQLFNLNDIEFRCGESAKELPLLTDSKFDLIFVDGSHKFEDVCEDCKWALKLCSENGVIVFHDYKEEGTDHKQRTKMMQVTAAIDKFLPELTERFQVFEVMTDGVVGGKPPGYAYTCSGKMGSLVCLPKD